MKEKEKRKCCRDIFAACTSLEPITSEKKMTGETERFVVKFQL